MSGATINPGGVFPENALRPEHPAEALRAQPAPAGLTEDPATQLDRGRSSPQVATQVGTVLVRSGRRSVQRSGD